MRYFHEQLQQLMEKVVLMGCITEVDDSHGRARARRTQRIVDRRGVCARGRGQRMQVEVDDMAVRLTALQQPVATDARFCSWRRASR